MQPAPTSASASSSPFSIHPLLKACRSARDRLLVLLLARAGLRRGEVVGLRRADVHFLIHSSALGCSFPGSHVHVVRRQNSNGAWAKSRRPRVVPVNSLIVQAHDQYVAERASKSSAQESDRSAGGSGRRTGRKPGTAPRPDPSR